MKEEVNTHNLHLLDPSSKIIRFYMNCVGWACLIFVVGVSVKIGMSVTGNLPTGSVPIFPDGWYWAWVKGLFMVPIFNYLNRAFYDKTYKPYRWNIIGKLFRSMAMTNAKSMNVKWYEGAEAGTVDS
ncbi:hypothetical protein LCGC14_1122560 [marine sediment metagenome]|uniref:Uncharacterized protein n=1 Tax=marine sediment metagenome TaxID=412755 RepID=A0A0F9MRD7_9ZZZZ